MNISFLQTFGPNKGILAGRPTHFQELILSGEKCTTIRRAGAGHRKYKEGDRLTLGHGMTRNKTWEPFATAKVLEVKCILRLDILIMHHSQIRQLAIGDGFRAVAKELNIPVHHAFNNFFFQKKEYDLSDLVLYEPLQLITFGNVSPITQPNL